MASCPLPHLSQYSSWRQFPFYGMLKPELPSCLLLGLQVAPSPLVNSKSRQYMVKILWPSLALAIQGSPVALPSREGVCKPGRIVVLEHTLSLQTLLRGAGGWRSESFPWITELLPCAPSMAPSPADSLPDPSSLGMAFLLRLMCKGALLKRSARAEWAARAECAALLVQAGAHNLHFSSTQAEVSFSSQGLNCASTEMTCKGAPYTSLSYMYVYTQKHIPYPTYLREALKDLAPVNSEFFFCHSSLF